MDETLFGIRPEPARHQIENTRESSHSASLAATSITHRVWLAVIQKLRMKSLDPKHIDQMVGGGLQLPQHTALALRDMAPVNAHGDDPKRSMYGHR